MSEKVPASGRPELFRDLAKNAFEVIERDTSLWEKLYGNTLLRKTVLLVAMASTWELYARMLNKPRLFPTLADTVAALFHVVRSGELPAATEYTIVLLLKGYVLGLLLAVALTAFASVSRIGTDLLELLTSMFYPLPSIALLPIAFLWFGPGSDNGLIFVIVHAVLWSAALNTHAGFRAVSPTLRMVGRNYGLSTAGYITRILVPGAFPSILTGLKSGWAFAWRTVLAAELVFGTSSVSGGLGWFISVHKYSVEIPEVFAGLLTVMILGLAVENLVFKTVEKRTVRRWGMEI